VKTIDQIIAKRRTQISEDVWAQTATKKLFQPIALGGWQAFDQIGDIGGVQRTDKPPHGFSVTGPDGAAKTP
jgi:hypothetical protein